MGRCGLDTRRGCRRVSRRPGRGQLWTGRRPPPQWGSRCGPASEASAWTTTRSNPNASDRRRPSRHCCERIGGARWDVIESTWCKGPKSSAGSCERIIESHVGNSRHPWGKEANESTGPRKTKRPVIEAVVWSCRGGGRRDVSTRPIATSVDDYRWHHGCTIKDRTHLKLDTCEVCDSFKVVSPKEPAPN